MPCDRKSTYINMYKINNKPVERLKGENYPCTKSLNCGRLSVVPIGKFGFTVLEFRSFQYGGPRYWGSKDLNFSKNYPPMEREGEGWQCSSLQRLHWDKNGQVSSFFLAEPNLHILNKLTYVWIRNSTLESLLHFCRIMRQDQSIQRSIQTSNFCRI